MDKAGAFLTIVLTIVMLVAGIQTAVNGHKLNPVYAMVISAVAGMAAKTALDNLFRGNPIEFALWGIFGLCMATGCARWLAANLWRFSATR